MTVFGVNFAEWESLLRCSRSDCKFGYTENGQSHYKGYTLHGIISAFPSSPSENFKYLTLTISPYHNRASFAIPFAMPHQSSAQPLPSIPGPTIQYACPYPGCRYTTTSRSNFSDHQRSHSTERGYVCRLGCGKTFKYRSGRSAHQKSCRGKKMDVPPKKRSGFR